jgi:hypothetical protein
MFKKFVTCFLVICFLVTTASVGLAESSYVIVPTQKAFVSAESRINDLAKKAEEQRINSGMYGAGLGILYIGLGAAYGKSSYYGTDYSTLYYAFGGGMLLLGLRSLMFPTELENSYISVRKMPSATVEERGAREASAEKSLKKGAEEAAQSRMIVSSIIGGSGLIFMGSSPFYGSLLLGTAALSYFMKSDIEKAFDEYMADKEDFIRSQPATPVVVPVTAEAGTGAATLEGK